MRSAAAGAGLLHPLTLASGAVLVLNDHLLKCCYPGVLSGKLSDFAGIVLMPVFLQAGYELAMARFGGRTPSRAASNRALAAAIAATCAVFGLCELWAPADTAYRVGLGVLQWPFFALATLVSEASLPALRPVQATMDPSDLFALTMAPVAWLVGRHPNSEQRSRAALAFHAALAAAALPTPAQAQAPPGDEIGPAAPAGSHLHDGFFLNFEGGAGFLLVDSTASISNGFQQRIPSSSADIVFPAAALELGGTLRGSGIALGGRLFMARCARPVTEIAGERFESPLVLQVLELSAIAAYYPDPTSGLHFSTGIGWLGLEPKSTHGGGEMQRGPSTSLEAAHGFWIGRQWSLGAALRVTAAVLSGDTHGRTTLLLPALYATLSLH
jgi:hypothetical protein